MLLPCFSLFSFFFFFTSKATTTPVDHHQQQAMERKMDGTVYDTIVIGAGVSGLSAGISLVKVSSRSYFGC